MTDSISIHKLHKLILEEANATIDIKKILINYKKLSKANISLAKTKSHLAELQALWKEVRYRHNDITFVATAEDRKKLSYFTQEDYYAAEDAYYKAADYLHNAMDSFVKPEDPVCDPKINSAFCDFAGALDIVLDDSRNVEDAYNEAADYLQEAISSFVKPVNDSNTDSITCNLADTLDTVTDNLRNKSRSFVNNVSVPKYVYCPSLHSLENCEKFLLLSVEQRNTLAREMQVCFNCLQSGYFAPKCPSNSRCMHCRRMHHSLLHLAVSEIADIQVTRTDVSRASDVLRATAWMNPHTSCIKVRTLLDQASTLSFISESLCRTLRATRQCANLEYVDLGKIVPAMRGRRLYSA